jgi:hypothetical protein
MAIATFHSQTENGIRRELFAMVIMAVIARVLMRLTTDPEHPSRAEPQFIDPATKYLYAAYLTLGSSK